MELGIIAKTTLDQDSMSNWLSDTDENYDYAKRFYEEKKKAFLNYLNITSEEQSVAIEDALNIIFQEVWNEGVIKALEMGIQNDIPGGQVQLTMINERYDLQLNYSDLYNLYSSKSKAQLGFEFEKVASQILTNYFKGLATQTSAMKDAQIDSLLYQFKQATGSAARSRAAHVRGAPLIRMDIGNMELEQKNQISYIKNSDSLTSELQSFIDVQNNRIQDFNTFPSDLQKYLEQGQFAGFSAKHMNKLMSEKFSQSSVIASSINEGLSLPAASGKRRRWQFPWAESYANWYVSKNLFNIIGPLDVGVIYGGGFQWMDTFLDKSRFRVRVKEDGGKSTSDPTYAYRKVKSTLYMTSAGMLNKAGKLLTISGSINGQ